MRYGVSRLLLLVSLAACLAGCSPLIVHLPTPTSGSIGNSGASGLPTPGATPEPRLLEHRQIELEWPETIREKDSDLITLTIAMDEQVQATATLLAPQQSGGTPVDIPNIYDTHNIVAVARLDMAGIEASREDIREPLLAGQPVTFLWSIRANEAGTYRGVVWLRLELVPKAGGPIDEVVLLARPIEVKAVTVFGLPGSTARILGGVGVLLSTVIGYPIIQDWIKAWLKRRKGKNQPPAPPQPGTTEVTLPQEPT